MAGHADGPLGSLIAAMKSWQPCPATLKVYLTDGTDRTVLVSKRRQKWQHLQRTLGAMPWAQVEGMDANGAMVGVYENPDLEPDGLEDIEGTHAVQTVQVAGLVNIMLKAQDIALRRQGDYHGRMMDQLVRVVDVLADRLVQSERAAAEYQELLAAVKAGDGGGDEALVQALPAILKLAAAPNAPVSRSANGVSKGHGKGSESHGSEKR